MKTLICRSLVLASCLLFAGCPNPEPHPARVSNDTPAPKVDLRFPGSPVTKIVAGENSVWVMTEKLVASIDDAERSLHWASLNQETLPLPHALQENEYLADIASAQKADQLWITAVPAAARGLKFNLRLIDKTAVLFETSINLPEEGLDTEHSMLDAPNPGEDTIKMVSHDDTLYIAARNKRGYPSLAVVRNGEVHAPIVVGPKYEGYFLGRNSGVYSVMEQLTSRYKLHITQCADKIVMAQTAAINEILDNTTLYGLTQKDLTTLLYVVVDEFSKATLERSKTQVFPIEGLLLHSVSCEGDNLIVSGSSRIKEDGASAPFIIRNGELSYLTSDFETSTSGQAAMTRNGTFILGGSTDWSQNPGGLSIDGGVGFLKIGNEVEKFGGVRTEVRSLANVGELLCYAGMTNGPTTHSHDQNPEAITGDGFVRCRPFSSEDPFSRAAYKAEKAEKAARAARVRARLGRGIPQRRMPH